MASSKSPSKTRSSETTGTARSRNPRVGLPMASEVVSDLRLPSAAVRRAFSNALLAYYRAVARKLPWRDNPTAYGVWVSEMMLQQTQVATVLPYYKRWMDRFPTLESLADAPQADVLGLWQGLGYYARARALHAGAAHVLNACDGQLPRTARELQLLPGIGPYTAGAIASIAFEQPAPIVDGNVIRVLCRVFGLPGSPLHQPLKAFLWELAEALIPAGAARDFNQALMEFGALCCTPKSPLCQECPLRKQCRAFAEHAVSRYPELPDRPKTTPIVNVAALIRRDDRILVGQLPSNAPRWPSMWQLPNVNLEPQESEAAGIERALRLWCTTTGRVGARVQTLQHSVTRYRITVNLFEIELSAEPTNLYCQALVWQDLHDLSKLAMPAAHRKLATRVLEA